MVAVKKYYAKNKAKIMARKKLHSDQNIEARRAYAAKWRESNRDRARAYAAKHKASKTPDQIAEWKAKSIAYHKKYYVENKEAIALKNREWRANNPEKVAAKYKNYLPRHYVRQKALRESDPILKMKLACRTRVYKILRKAGIPKFNHTFEIIGCTPDFFKAHIESLFTEGMTWDNYGDWEVDHRRPVASFDFSIKEECLAAFHYSNCQPLWKMENRMKSAKLTYCPPSPQPQSAPS